MQSAFEWFAALPEQGQATIVAAAITGICGVGAALVKDRYEQFVKALRAVAFVSLVALVVLATTPLDVAGAKNAFRIPPHHARNVKMGKWYGYFGDISDEKVYIGKEEIDLIRYETPEDPNVRIVLGTARGAVLDPGGHTVKKVWYYTGYERASHLALSYYTDDGGEGVGSYHLIEKGGHYCGYWIGRDQITHKAIIGPYVLTSQDLTVEEADRRFKELKEAARVVGTHPPSS